MRLLLQCRRGTVAMMVGLTAIPAIGLVALGTEAGVWYATQRQAQNAADAAAYSGALRLAKADGQTIAYRGKEFAAQNGFCNPADLTYPGSVCIAAVAATQAVTINSPPVGGAYAGNVNAVQAIVTQTQPPLLSSLFLTGNITIAAQAVALIKQPSNPCVLALAGSISFQGSPTVSLPGCGMASNSTAANAINFTGNGGISVTGPIVTEGGCTGTTALCAPVVTNGLPVVDPLAALETAMAGFALPACTNAQLSAAGGIVAYTALTPCKNDNLTLSGNTTLTLTGVYFISGTLTMKGTTALSSGANGATIVMLPGSSFSMKGSGTINITGPTAAPAQLPSAFSSPACPTCASLFKNLAIFDADASAVTIGGTSNLNFSGNLYFPLAPVTFQGNPTVNACGELIAASIAFNGNSTFTNSGCATNGVVVPTTQVVQLVQ